MSTAVVNKGMVSGSPYDSAFFASRAKAAEVSARHCVPVILDLLAPRSVVDVGCGLGEWLEAFREKGVQDILGIDGDYVNRAELRIPQHAFQASNLGHTLRLDRKFDVAVSLEVAEHLPSSCSKQFVCSLVSLAPAVVFSAAVPGQGGVQHLNEQWHWHWQNLFAASGYVCLDPFRKIFWQDPAIEVFYQSNMFLYVDPKVHQKLIEGIGAPDKYHELTLVRTTILRDLVEGGWIKKQANRVFSRLRRLVGRGKN